MERIVRLLMAVALCMGPSAAWCETVHVDLGNAAGPWDGTPDHPYRTIQEGIDAAQAEDTVAVAPGTYAERIAIVAKDGILVKGAGATTTEIDGQLGGHVVEFQHASGGSISGFTIRDSGSSNSGVWVVESSVSIHDNVIVNNGYGIASMPFNPDPGSHLVIERNRVVDSVLTYGSGIEIRRGTGRIAGNVVADNPNNAVRLVYASIDVIGNTIANNASGWGIYYTVPPVPVSILHNIVTGSEYGILVLGSDSSSLAMFNIAYNDFWNNSIADYWEEWGGTGGSFSQPFTPQPGTGEIHVDPGFVDPAGQDYSLSAASPCLDAGPPPEEFTGTPCLDAEGGPRLRDADGDGLAHPDIGALERRDPLLQPGEVENLGWAVGSPDLLVWDPEPSSDEYGVYRGDVAALGYQSWGACLGSTATSSFLDAEVPPSGSAFFYVVTGATFAGEAGTMGFGTCAERSNFSSCP